MEIIPVRLARRSIPDSRNNRSRLLVEDPDLPRDVQACGGDDACRAHRHGVDDRVDLGAPEVQELVILGKPGARSRVCHRKRCSRAGWSGM